MTIQPITFKYNIANSTQCVLPSILAVYITSYINMLVLKSPIFVRAFTMQMEWEICLDR